MATSNVSPSGDGVATAATAPVRNGSPGLEEEGGDEGSSFVPSLRSDVAPSDALQLLQSIATTDATYSHFTTAELRALISVLSVLRVPAGDTVIVRGEEATFGGIVLQGSLIAQVSPALQIELGPGALVGEMALFEGGTRNADIRAGSGSDAVLGVLTFAELHELGTVHPALARALYVLFATASMRKLRKMTMNPQQLAELARKDDEKLAMAARLRAKADGSAPPATSAVAAPEPALTSDKRELLYRLRLEKDTAAAAAAAAATAVPEKKGASVPGKASSKSSRANDKVRLENATRKLALVTTSLEEREKELEEIRAEMRKVLRAQVTVEKSRDEAFASVAKITAQLTAETAAKLAQEQRLTAALASTARESEARWEPQLVALRAELARSKAESETAGLHARRTAEEHLKLLDANRSMSESLGELTEIRNQLFAEIFEARKKCTQFEREANEHARVLVECRSTLRALEIKNAEQEEKINQLTPWKTKALEAQQSIVAEQARATRAVEEALKGKVELEEDKLRLQKVLKLVVIGTFVRESRFKRALAATHEQVSDMLLHSLEENITSAASPSGLVSSAADGTGGKGGSEVSSGAGILSGVASSVRPSLKSIQKRKKAYLSALLHSRVRPREIISSLSDEIQKLRAPLEESLERVAHWKRTSEAFFARNIELTAQKEELSQALTQTSSKIDHARSLMKKDRGEQEEIVLRNQELQRTNIMLRTEIDKLTGGTGSAVVAHAAASAAAAGNFASPSGVATPVSSTVSPSGTGGAQSTPSKQNKKGSAGTTSPPNESHILTLQRQQQMLQTNIHMLQAHYNTLLAGVQQQQQQGVLAHDEKQDSSDAWSGSPRSSRSLQHPSSTHSSRSNLHQAPHPPQPPHPQHTPYPPHQPQALPVSAAGQIQIHAPASPLRPLQHTVHPAASLSPHNSGRSLHGDTQHQQAQQIIRGGLMLSPTATAQIQQALQRQTQQQNNQSLQRDKYNQAVAAGGGSSQTPRKVAAAAVAAAEIASPRTINGYHLPPQQLPSLASRSNPVLLTLSKPARTR